MSDVLFEAININKAFGTMRALDNVSLKLRRHRVHALLGENGAGKSTLVKCIMGYYTPDQGQLLYDGKEVVIHSPQQAASLGLGMVYQHFTLIDNMSVAESIVLSRPHLPPVIDWPTEIAALQQRMASMPFQCDLLRKVGSLSVGEKQKVEIVKQLLLNSRILILDEPTSVLTPNEADNVLGEIFRLTRETDLTVLMITHKFREVMQYADDITVLRKGQWIGATTVAESTPQQLSDMMIGGERLSKPPERSSPPQRQVALEVRALVVNNDQGLKAVDALDLQVAQGEIVGIAGVSGNGQKLLVEALSGQRPAESGEILAHNQRYSGTQAHMRERRFYCLPEEPLRNACVGDMSVADNLVLRSFNQPPFRFARYFIQRRQIQRNAREFISRYKVRCAGPEQEIRGLSGGNIQRVVLARELAQRAEILVVTNPCFGLDFKAVADIRGQILEARNAGTAIVLISEDLDEILELSDRFFVMAGGKLVYETTPAQANLTTVGQYMAGH